jgi:hypothetical protein
MVNSERLLQSPESFHLLTDLGHSILVLLHLMAIDLNGLHPKIYRRRCISRTSHTFYENSFYPLHRTLLIITWYELMMAAKDYAR